MKNPQKNTLKNIFIDILKNIKIFLPFLTGILLLTHLISQFIPEDFIVKSLSFSSGFQVFIANIIGSLFFSNASQSYILGGEFLQNGVSLLAITSFMVSWVTIGLIHVPFEIQFLGKKFTFIRNVSSFILSFGVAYLTVFLYSSLC